MQQKIYVQKIKIVLEYMIGNVMDMDIIYVKAKMKQSPGIILVVGMKKQIRLIKRILKVTKLKNVNLIVVV